METGFLLREATLFNEVATPTKLVENITYGIVPAVLSPDIGDFLQYGYRYLLIWFRSPCRIRCTNCFRSLHALRSSS